MARLFFLFAIVPVVEIALLIRIGERLGAMNTIAIVIVTAMIGSFLAKREGFSILNRLRSKLSTAQIPTDELVDGGIVLVCAALLLTPGVLTDIVGFLGLVPLTRAPIRKYIKNRFSNRVVSGGFQVNRQQNETSRQENQSWQKVKEEGLQQPESADISNYVNTRTAKDS